LHGRQPAAPILVKSRHRPEKSRPVYQWAERFVGKLLCKKMAHDELLGK
jgi:hypothetical protein